MAQETTVAVKINASTGGTESVKSLKAQIREATNEAVLLAQKFGEFSPEAQQAAARVADLKDQMEDFGLRVKGLNPDKFTVFANVGQGIARGIQGATGAMALFGIEGENATKILAKVQGATAFAEGVQGIMDMSKGMKGFVQTTIQGFKGIRGAIAATGIGLLLVALGTVVAYWDDIKGAVGGVTAEQKKLNELAEKNLAAEEKKFETLELSENSLKLQGKSERDIQKMKVNQLNTEIEKAKVVVKNAKTSRDLEVAAAKRNKDITQQIIRGGMEVSAMGLRLLAAPIDALIATANAASEALGFGKITTFSINAEITKMVNNFSEGAAKFLFNPEEVAKEGDKTIAEAEKKLLELTSKRDGILLEMRNQDIEAAKAGAEAANKLAENQRKAQIEVAQLQAKSLQEQLDAAEMAWAEEIKGEQYKGWTLEQLQIKHDNIMAKIRADYLAKKKADEDKDKEDEKKREQERQAYKEKVNQSMLDANAAYYEAQRRDAIQTSKTQIELAQRLQSIELEQLQANLDAMTAIKGENSKEAIEAELALAQKRKEIADREEEATKATEAAKRQMRLDTLSSVSSILGSLADLAGENEKTQKAFALAQIATDTAIALSNASATAFSPASPDNAVTGGLAGVAKYASFVAIILSNAARARQILKGGGGGGAGGNAPATPNAPQTTPLTGGTLPDTEAGQFAGMGKVYVLEGDITKTQTRVRRVRNVSVV